MRVSTNVITIIDCPQMGFSSFVFGFGHPFNYIDNISVPGHLPLFEPCKAALFNLGSMAYSGGLAFKPAQCDFLLPRLEELIRGSIGSGTGCGREEAAQVSVAFGNALLLGYCLCRVLVGFL